MNRLGWSVKTILSVALIGFSSFLPAAAWAEDLGVIGKTYLIAEQDLIEAIKERIAEKQGSGEMDALNDELVSKGKQYAKRPPGASLPRASSYRAVEVVPEYTAPNDIVDATGKVIYPKGTTVNPLEMTTLTKALCFFDGDDSRQVEWIKEYCTSNIENKLILVSGDVGQMGKEFGRVVYFDQRAYLVGRLGIEALPAVIRQSGTSLYVEEFPMD